jgi:large subunit ribosomal protein L28
MSKVCSICGKHPVAGRSISHSHRVTNRMFRPNVQRITIKVNGVSKKTNVCTECIRSGKIERG